MKDDGNYLREQAWNYFQMHASQRLTTFNFYIIISSVITTGLVTTFQQSYGFPRGGIFLGCLLAFFSFVFWKLDKRTKHLIRNAEAALRAFENMVEANEPEGTPGEARLFSYEEWETQQRKLTSAFLFWTRQLSYSDCFNLVFLSFAVVGVIGATTSLVS